MTPPRRKSRRENPRLHSRRARDLTSGRSRRGLARSSSRARFARSILPRGRRSTGRVACITLAYGPPRCGGSAPGEFNGVTSNAGCIYTSAREGRREKEHGARHARERAREITELKSAVSRPRALARRLSGVTCMHVCARARVSRRSIFPAACVCARGLERVYFDLSTRAWIRFEHLDTIRFILDIVLAGEFRRRRARDARETRDVD